QLPPVLHGQAEARRHGRPRRALPAPRQAPEALTPGPGSADPIGVPDRSSAALEAQRDAPVGGQAVLEGVMMRGVSTWAVAVRKPLPEQIADGRELEVGEAAQGEI